MGFIPTICACSEANLSAAALASVRMCQGSMARSVQAVRHSRRWMSTSLRAVLMAAWNRRRTLQAGLQMVEPVNATGSSAADGMIRARYQAEGIESRRASGLRFAPIRVRHRQLLDRRMRVTNPKLVDGRWLAAAAFEHIRRAMPQCRFPLSGHRRMHAEPARWL